MARTTKSTRVLHNVGDVVFMPANREEGWAAALGTITGIDKRSKMLTVELDEQFREEDDEDGLVEVSPEDVKTPTPKQLASREAKPAKSAKKATKSAGKAPASDEPAPKAKKGAKKGKKALGGPRTRSTVDTHEAIGLEERVSLEQSVGAQIVHCLRKAMRLGAEKADVTKAMKHATRMAETGNATESALRSTRDILRGTQPDADTIDGVIFRRACRGIGMVITRLNSDGEDE